MAKKQRQAAIEIIPPRKRAAPRTAYKKGQHNPHQFQPGQSGNPSGKSKDDLKLVSRSLREQLSTRAPNEVAKGVGLPAGSSYAQCCAASILRSTIGGDMQAARLLVETVEGKAPTALNIGGIDGQPLFGDPVQRPMINVHFVESNGDGRFSDAERTRVAALTIDALPTDVS